MTPARRKPNSSTAVIFAALFVVFNALAVCACRGTSGMEFLPQSSNEPGWHSGTLRHDGLKRAFRFFIPEELSAGAPLVMLLHGGTRSMDELLESEGGGAQEWPDIAADNDFVLLVPNGTHARTGAPTGDHQVWNDCRVPQQNATTKSDADDVGFLMALADWAEARFDSDPGRFYVTGASNGGMMSYRLAIERPDRVAAIAAFIANFPVESECPAPSRPIPVMMMNGTADPLMPYEGGATDGRGRYLSAPETRNKWVAANDAETDNRQIDEIPNRNTDDESIIICEKDPASGSDSEPVDFCRVEGGGHSVPSVDHQIGWIAEQILGPQNHDIEGARYAWKFLSRHRL